MINISSETETELEIVSQTSLAEEKYSKNGVQKNVHVVVKNTGFSIVLGIVSPTPEFDFRRLQLEASLMYDSDTAGVDDEEEDKLVDFVRMKPLEFKARPKETGEECSVDLRIKVLTSQLEDSFFRVRFRALDSLTKAVIPNLTCYSEPIKVISKPDQIKKKPQKIKKRNISELVVDSLQRIEEQQIEHFRFLQQLHTRVQHTPSEVSFHVSQLVAEKQLQLCGAGGAGGAGAAPNAENFDQAFGQFMSSFMSLPAEDRPTKIRKLIRAASAREVDQLTEMLDMFFAEGLQKQLPLSAQTGGHPHHHHNNPHGSDLSSSSSSEDGYDAATMMVAAAEAAAEGGCGGTHGCSAHECPHKRELARIDEFYKDFLSSTYLAEQTS